MGLLITGVFCLSMFLLHSTGYAQNSPERMKLSEFLKDSARVESLKRGVGTMKSRPPSDPKSWFFQSAVHGVTQDAINNATSIDPGVANVDASRFWNQCPHSGQPAADFLIWHRAYLHYFERILREAAGDPNLRLPYWDYSGSERGFPEILADPDRDPNTGQPRNPLFDVRREVAFMVGMYELSDRAVDISFAMRQNNFFGATEDTGLAGG